MLAKELVEARWKIILGLLFAVGIGAFVPFTYEMSRYYVGAFNPEILPPAIREQLDQAMSSYDAFVWYQWFGRIGLQIIVVLAALLGGSLIAGEVSRGTIFFLLSKPLSRERILLSKIG